MHLDSSSYSEGFRFMIINIGRDREIAESREILSFVLFLVFEKKLKFRNLNEGRKTSAGGSEFQKL